MTDIHAKAKKGIKLLMGRQVFLQILTFGGGVILARVLGPSKFGLYSIALFLVNAFALFGDFGLAPSLIQRKEELTDFDLRVAFTLQQIMTTFIVVMLLVFAPWLARYYPKAPPETVWLVRSLAANLYLVSWRTMSALQLERHLKYDKLAKIEVLEALTFQATAVTMALTGHGVWSYVFAILASGLVGSTLVYLASPWKVRFDFDKGIALGILRFGIPFQLQQLVNQAGGWVSPLLVGRLIGPQAVGFLTWSTSNGRKPLSLVDNVMRVAFPHFSRIQDDRAEVQRTIVKYLNWLLIPAGLWFSVMAVSAWSIVPIIYTTKWLPAVPALILFSAALSMDVISWVVGVSLNSLGSVGFMTRMIFIRTVLSIVASVVCVFKFGFLGVPIGYISAAVIVVPWMLQGFGKGQTAQILGPLAWIFVPVLVSVGLGEIDVHLVSPAVLRAITSVIVVVAAYIGTVWLAGPAFIKDSVRTKVQSRLSGVSVAVSGAAE